MENKKLIKERAEVEKILDALDQLRHGKEFLALDRTEQVLLNRQSHVMHGLMEIYDERINFLKQKPRS